MGSIKLAELNEQLTALEQELTELKEENHILQAKSETSLSLEELERYATEELGMQRLKPSQIFYIDLSSHYDFLVIELIYIQLYKRLGLKTPFGSKACLRRWWSFWSASD